MTPLLAAIGILATGVAVYAVWALVTAPKR
jgi:hypothetical protein